MDSIDLTKGIIRQSTKVVKGLTFEDTGCLHHKCQECHGSGVKKNHEPCVHMISCQCPRCSTFRC